MHQRTSTCVREVDIRDTEPPSIRHRASAQAGQASLPRLPGEMSTHEEVLRCFAIVS